MRLEGEVRGLAIASRNASDGQALIDTAEGALREAQCSYQNARTGCSSTKRNTSNNR